MNAAPPMTAPEPHRDCGLCPRLAAHRAALRAAEPGWHNAPVRSLGEFDAGLLVVGLAPGRNGANRTGRPFTGDAAGMVLYPALIRHGFASGTYAEHPGDGLVLTGCRITNAVRCLPPGNKPVGNEISNCRSFLKDEILAMPALKVILALGRIAHGSVVAAMGQRQAALPFAHGTVHRLPGAGRESMLADSYHCSRYNLNTGRLTVAMFDQVLSVIRNQFD